MASSFLLFLESDKMWKQPRVLLQIQNISKKQYFLFWKLWLIREQQKQQKLWVLQWKSSFSVVFVWLLARQLQKECLAKPSPLWGTPSLCLGPMSLKSIYSTCPRDVPVKWCLEDHVRWLKFRDCTSAWASSNNARRQEILICYRIVYGRCCQFTQMEVWHTINKFINEWILYI